MVGLPARALPVVEALEARIAYLHRLLMPGLSKGVVEREDEKS